MIRVFSNSGIIIVALFSVTIITSCGKDKSPSGGSAEPEITSIKPDSGSVGTTVTISGSNFGATQDNNSVTFNRAEATLSSADESEIVAVVPDSATTGPIAVSTDGQTVTGPAFTVFEDQALSITSEDSLALNENSTAVDTITTSGVDVTFSLTGGADQDQFGIDASSGALAFTEAPDFETPADTDADNVYQVQVSADDGSESTSQDLTVTVTDLNEDQAPSITSDVSFSVEENSTSVGTITATDPNGDEVTFSLSGGADQDQLGIDASSGALAFTEAPDFEQPADTDADNVYQVQVSADDGSESTSQDLTVSVTDVSENQAPSITSESSFSVEENTTSIGTITVSDPNGDEVTFSLSGGVDQDQLGIDASSGALAFTDAPDFETPADANADNVYQVQVSADDGSESTSQDLTISVTDMVEKPAISSFSPTTGNAGTTVTITGENFSRTPANNTVRFKGADTPAVISSGSTTQLEIEIPADATTGTITVTVGSQTATSASDFTIIPFSGGSGTAADPYQVETTDELQAVRQYLDAHFIQTKNIDASSTATANGGAGFAPIGTNNTVSNRFSGSYNGRGYTINGLTINRGSDNFVGLFGYVSDNANIQDVHFTSADITGRRYTGVLTGFNRGTIDNSSASGSVSGMTYVGGLVGINRKSVHRSHADVEVIGGSQVGGLLGNNEQDLTNSYATGSVNGNGQTGGLVGFNDRGDIVRSYSAGTVNGGAEAGGLVGKSRSGSIMQSYTSGAVSGGTEFGGLVGANEAGTTIIDSYWDGQATGQASSEGGTMLDTAQMLDAAAETNMTGFDFTNVWQTRAGDYPILRNVGGQ